MTNKCSGDTPEHIREALCVLGDKWSALILRMLHDKPRRFKDFETELSGMSSRTLTQRLDKLTSEGIIEKATQEDSSYHMYKLTDKGVDLDDVIHAMATWGERHKT